MTRGQRLGEIVRIEKWKNEAREAMSLWRSFIYIITYLEMKRENIKWPSMTNDAVR